MRFPGSDAIAMALQVPLRRPGRSALTTLGLAIGVAAFIAMVNFGRGARSSVVEQFETLGSNLLRVKTYYGKTEQAPRLLGDSDVRALERESTTIELIVPYAVFQLPVTHGSRTTRTSVEGTTPDFMRTSPWEVAQGGVFDATDLAQRNKVCVLGATTASQLLGGGQAVGQVVTIDGRLPCRVIGVLEAQGESISGGDMDDRIILPVSTVETHLGLPNGYYQLHVRPKSRELLQAAKAEINEIMRREHEIEPGEADDFHVISPDEVTAVVDQVGAILTGLLAGIAGVSLLVGGIGIMNLQLVSIAERTHEIGIRAALGAAPAQIEHQFLAEAVVLAAIGSAVGVLFGYGISLLVATQMQWPAAIAPDIAIGAALFGLVVGTVFGYIPARRAARLDPIEALRRE